MLIMLELSDIHTYYGDSYVLQGVSLKVEKASVVALLGRNGMGKTTTIHSIMGITPPRRGTIMFQGRDLAHMHSQKIARLGIGLVPQGRRIFPSLSVQENLTMAARGGNGDSSWNLGRVYELFPVLKERARTRGTSLSGGEQSLLNIARALMTNPALVLMDEPSEGLSPLMVNMVAKIIGHLRDDGVSVLLVEQNLPLALKVADYLYIMGKGTVIYESVCDNSKENEEMVARHICV
jgi:branched-chain amino acid transport system ATP-binding protein